MIGNLDELRYEGGYPTAETVQKLYDQLDLQRAAQAYLDFMPAMSMQALLDMHPRDHGVSEAGGMIVYTEPGEGRSKDIGLTYNTESMYASLSLDLKQTGPAVIEVPPNVLGVINDGFFLYLADLGNAGPDRGKGGKYLLLPPGYEGDVPDGYFVFRSSTWRNWVMAHGFEHDTGRGEAALAYYKAHFKVYPLGEGVHQPGVVSASFTPSDSTFARDIRYFERLHQMVQYEPLSAFTPEQLGLLHALGIVKGAAFQPDERMRRILSDGVRLGDGMAKAIMFASRDPEARVYPDRHWERVFIGGYKFERDGARLLDARTLWHYGAIVVTPAMEAKMVGVGSQYLTTYKDASGAYLDGGQRYRLRLPAGIPAKNFWSVTVYDTETRSLLQNGQPKPSISSAFDQPEVNPDNSVDIYFGPAAPEGKEKNWIRTVPGKGHFVWIRLYGPLEAFFEQTWRPDDIVKVLS
ncbi:MAG: DUF1254 domain-containing protein [Deltaproteobacteria bacterium]|nr:DUF1254 domain-containing protein [Deltaproteobacteria bacterium]